MTNQKNLVKNPIRRTYQITNQKDPIKMNVLKLTCPKWHFGKVGVRGPKIIWGSFWFIFSIKKLWFLVVFQNAHLLLTLDYNIWGMFHLYCHKLQRFLHKGNMVVKCFCFNIYHHAMVRRKLTLVFYFGRNLFLMHFMIKNCN